MTSPTPSPIETEPGIREHLATLGRRKVTIALTAALAVGAATMASLLQTPQYRSEAQVLVPTAGVAGALPVEGDDPERTIRNEVDFVESDAVTGSVETSVSDGVDLSIAASDERDTLRFSAVSTDADEAAEAANLYADTYIEERRRESVDTLETTRASVLVRVGEIDTAIGQIQFVGGPDAQARIDALNAERVELQATLTDLQLSLQLAESGGPTRTRQAEPAAEPFEPNLARNVAVALGVGLLLGVALAFVREQLDDTVTSRAELEAAAGGLPVLGIIPRAGDSRGREPMALAAAEDPDSPAAEAYRTLRTAVQFLSVERTLSTLLVTSPGAGDGKTTTVANLAITISRAGRRCAVVCGDLRRPTVHEVLSLNQRPGLTTVLLGEESLDGAVQPVRGEDGLALLASGDLPPNPSELLSSEGTAKALRTLSESYEILLIDAPPVLPVTDATVLAQQVDGVVLVADARQTELADIREASQRLRQVDAPLVGTVLNDADVSTFYAYDAP